MTPAAVETGTFTIRRGDLVRVAAEEYVRRFWWVIVGMPISGVVLLLTIDSPIARYIGFVAVAWPLTIPARGVLITTGKAKSLARPTRVSVDSDAVYFHDESGGGTKIPLSRVSGVRKSGDLYVIQTVNFNFSLIDSRALESDDQRAAFEAAVRRAPT